MTCRPLVVALLLGSGRPVAAQPTQLGISAGPRLFSDDSRLGFVEASRGHPSLELGMQVSVRLARAFLPWRWLVPELELAVARTTTTPEDGARRVDVSWLQPRFHLRAELPGHTIRPFLVAGGGAPIVVAPANYTMESGLTGEAYAGGGVRVDLGRALVARLDARISAHPGIEFYVTREYEVGVGLEVAVGGRKPAHRAYVAPVVDRCPDRDEDLDGFEDADGCPDIDNDGDHVLDLADACINDAEAFNGFLDGDGCPDALPEDLASVRGVIAGVMFAELDAEVNDSARDNLARIAKRLSAYPETKIVLLGYTDGTEPAQLATDGGDPDALAEALGLARAEGVKQGLIEAGLDAARIRVEGRGGSAPLGPETTPRERLANRRVELRLHVTPH